MNRAMIPAAAATLLAAMGLSGLPPAAIAQEGSGVEAFRAADANGDRLVTLDEFQAVRTGRFNSRDRNQDGFLSRDDLGGIAGRFAAGGAERHLAEIDLDGDSRISRREFFHQGQLLFEAADANHDGAVSHAEIAALSR